MRTSQYDALPERGGSINDENYQSVAERIRLFREKYPEGSLTALDPSKPFEIVQVDGQAFVSVAAVARRTPDDLAGGMGLAWCPIPGHDEYTRNSEIQNAQTSAWGRAIIAVLAADASKIASREEVRSAESHRTAPADVGPTRVSSASKPAAASATATSVKPTVAPSSTDPAQEEYNAAVVTESVRLLNDPSTSYAGLRDVWQVLNQGNLSARRVPAPAGMEPDGDGLVPIGAAVVFVGKERKLAEEAAAQETPAPEPTPESVLEPMLEPAEEAPAPAPRRGRKATVPSE